MKKNFPIILSGIVVRLIVFIVFTCKKKSLNIKFTMVRVCYYKLKQFRTIGVYFFILKSMSSTAKTPFVDIIYESCHTRSSRSRETIKSKIAVLFQWHLFCPRWSAIFFNPFNNENVFLILMYTTCFCNNFHHRIFNRFESLITYKALETSKSKDINMISTLC